MNNSNSNNNTNTNDLTTSNSMDVSTQEDAPTLGDGLDYDNNKVYLLTYEVNKGTDADCEKYREEIVKSIKNK